MISFIIDKSKMVTIGPVKSRSLTFLVITWLLCVLVFFSLAFIKVIYPNENPILLLNVLFFIFFLGLAAFGGLVLRWCWNREDKILFDEQWTIEKSGFALKKRMIFKKDEVYDMVVCKRPGSLDSVSNYKFLGVGLWMLKIKSKRGNLNIGLGISKEDATKIRETFKQHFT